MRVLREPEYQGQKVMWYDLERTGGKTSSTITINMSKLKVKVSTHYGLWYLLMRDMSNFRWIPGMPMDDLVSTRVTPQTRLSLMPTQSISTRNNT